jgi:hypothetical protein
MRLTTQRGTVEPKKRAKGPDVWVLRYKEGAKYRSNRSTPSLGRDFSGDGLTCRAYDMG